MRCLVIIISYYCWQNHEEHPELSEGVTLFNASAIPFFFGVAVFDFEGNGIVINLHASMKEPEKFNQVLNITLTIYVCMLCAFSSLAYYVSNFLFFTFVNCYTFLVIWKRH